MKLDQYTPIKYTRKVKKIKNLLKRYDEVDILKACLDYLYAPTNNEIEYTRRQPWLVLLILKWTFIGTSKIEYKKDRLDSSSFNYILQTTHKLGNLVKMPTEYSHLNLFMRNIAYQQFLFQHPFSLQQYGRQSYLFGSLPKNHTLEIWFKNKHGITCNEFLSLSFALLAYFVNTEKPTIDQKWFESIHSLFGKRTIEKFLDLMSVDLNQLKKELNSANSSKGGYNEYYEQTPFINFPLIKDQDNFTNINPYILYRNIEHKIYDSLKSENPEKFMRYFGDIFEKYLTVGMNYASLNFIPEKELKKILPSDVNCVDYIVMEENSNIFIDAKAVEMPYLGKISDNPKIIEGKVKSSVIKAIKQAYELNDFLLKSENKNLPTFKESSYLLVVTYKELYLGNGKSFYESIGK